MGTIFSIRVGDRLNTLDAVSLSYVHNLAPHPTSIADCFAKITHDHVGLKRQYEVTPSEAIPIPTSCCYVFVILYRSNVISISRNLCTQPPTRSHM